MGLANELKNCRTRTGFSRLWGTCTGNPSPRPHSESPSTGWGPCGGTSPH
jgi:hypothetical protein